MKAPPQSLAQPLADLRELDRSLLHVFVCGPGVGEGVLVALPDSGWLVIDGCEVNQTPRSRCSVPLAVLERYAARDEVLELVVLTHPHDDHAAGVAKVLNARRPKRIMVTAKSPMGPFLHEIAAKLYELNRSSPTSTLLREGSVASALRAIKTSVDDGAQLVAGTASVRALFGGVEVAVHAPAAGQHLQRVLAEVAKGNRARANHASVALELSWSQLRLVFGGDLPTTHAGRTVPTGWGSVMKKSLALATHAFLKLPHHGSAEAFEPLLHTRSAAQAPRVWTLTPYARGKSPLPATAELKKLTGQQDPLLVTSPLAAWGIPAGSDSAQVASLGGLMGSTGDPFADGAADITPQAMGAIDAVWGVAFDANARVVGCWRGAAALQLHR